ncbi:MAG: formate dehydrogenase accessory protein FdhE [Deltaproteobacteria bacterium]|nr:formate dehydrogenase accessory protein FdhE [Deltaproteobacteria bacterium]
MHAKTNDSLEPVVKRLRTLAHERPDLKEAAQLYESILPLLGAADLHVVPVSITPEEARAKLETGQPLLAGLDLDMDLQAAADLLLKLVCALETMGGMRRARRMDTADYATDSCTDTSPLLPVAVRSIRLAAEENTIDIGSLLMHCAAGERLNIESTARHLHLDPGLLWTLVQSALKPALHAWRRQLAPLGEETRWQQGYCFICGAHATLGELRNNGQALHLRCGQCGADWQFRRLRCIWCGNDDHGTLSCLYREDHVNKMRIEACERCHGFLKVIASFFPTPPEMLPVADLETLHLDFIAQKHGYERRGGISDTSGRSHLLEQNRK